MPATDGMMAVGIGADGAAGGLLKGRLGMSEHEKRGKISIVLIFMFLFQPFDSLVHSVELGL